MNTEENKWLTSVVVGVVIIFALIVILVTVPMKTQYYTVQEEYTDYETVIVQEPYDAIETYTEQEPYTDTVTKYRKECYPITIQVPCDTCPLIPPGPGPRPPCKPHYCKQTQTVCNNVPYTEDVTRYREVTKERTVTKWRNKEVQEPVQKWRKVQKTRTVPVFQPTYID